MCRIAGFWDFCYKRDYDLEKVAIEMRDTLVHGGPDDEGIYIDFSNFIALSHRRLSILDLSPLGHQPMSFDDMVLVYNGEVYNFTEIKNELQKLGYSFISNSDTEVVLKAFHKWGLDAISKFRGMFAAAIWNKKEKKLYLIRDRLGVKPLYYYFKNGLFLFASELKAFHKHPKFIKQLNLQALGLYLQYGYITSPYTIFENTYKLEPGNVLIVDQTGKLTTTSYWNIEEIYSRGLLTGTEHELTEELEKTLKESFMLRMVSDVPVGIFLSGGIDSTTVTALIQSQFTKPLKTFTIGFYEEQYNEAVYAKNVAKFLGTDHTELYCTPKDAVEIIPKLPELYDEPFGDSSAIPTYLVSKLAKSKVKVSLSADGGDEQFCGYTRYWLVGYRIKKINSLPLPINNILYKTLDLINPDIVISIYNIVRAIFPKYNNLRDKFIKFKEVLRARNIYEQYDTTNKYFLDDDVRRILISNQANHLNHSFKTNGISSTNIYDYMMMHDLKTYLPDDILVKVDRASMGVSLESREPFLDHKILEFSLRLPINLKYRNGVSKYLLRKIISKYIPKKFIDRPKMGFGVPIYEWFKKDLARFYKDYLNSERIRKEGLFNHIEVERLLNAYLEKGYVNHNKLWFLFVFELWREKWLG